MNARDEDEDDVPTVTIRRRTIIIGSVALATVVILVFAGGLLTGIGVVTSNQGKAKPAPTSQATPVTAPSPPPAPIQAARPEPSVPPPAPPPPPVEAPKAQAAAPAPVEPPMRPTARNSTRQETKPEAKPATRPATNRPQPAPVKSGEPYFTVQTGSFNDQAKATRAADALRKKGYDAEATQGIDTSGKAWNVVRVGKFPDRKSAGAQAAKLKSQDKIDGMIVKVGGKAG